MIVIMVDMNHDYDNDGGSNHDHRGQIGFLLCLYCVSLNVFFFVSNLIRFSPLVNFSGSQLNFLETPSSFLLFNSQPVPVQTFCHYDIPGLSPFTGRQNDLGMPLKPDYYKQGNYNKKKNT